MKENVLKYYKKNVRAYALVFSKMKWLFRILMTLFIITTVFSAFFCIAIIAYAPRFWSAPIIVISISTFFFFSMFLIVFLFFNYRAKVILKEKFAISNKRIMWRTEKFDRIQLDLLIDFLRRSNLLTKYKVEKLIELYQEEIKSGKVAPLIAPSIFIAMITPTWTQYLVYLYTKNSALETATQAQSLLFGTIGQALVVLLAVGMTIKFKNEIVETFFSEQLNLKKNLISLLEDILLEIPEEQV